MHISICTLLIFLMSPCLGLYAQSLNVAVSQDSVLLGNQIRLTYELQNIDAEIKDPYLENCRVSGPNVSSQYQNMNGEVSQKKSYTYYLTPLLEGQLLIQEMTIDSGDSIISSDPIYISVLPNPEGIIQEDPSMNSGDFQNFFFESPMEKEELEKPPIQNKTKKSKRKRRKI